MVKKFTIPFASQGDANDIPDALQVDGKVSFTQGFGYDYERPYDDPQAKDIAREDMNGLFKAITSAVGELQTLGASEWSSAISYPKGAIVYFEKDLYISQVDDNQNKPPQSWVSITSIANDSLKKAANLSDLTNKTTARNNLGLGSSATLNKTDVLGTSSSLVATQKLVNDTKINLESSKQDKLTFVGDGPEVMRVGAFGLGRNPSTPDDLTNSKETAFHYWGNTELVIGESTLKKLSTGIMISGSNSNASFMSIDTNTGELYTDGKGGAVWKGLRKHYDNKNTTTDKSGFLRASGSANALTTSDVTQSLGTSTSLVASQALVNSVSKQVADHGLGYGQNWVDVTSQRAMDTTYTNNTGKPILISVSVVSGKAIQVHVDSVVVVSLRCGAGNEAYTDSAVTVIVPAKSTYRLAGYTTNPGFTKCVELR